MTRTLTTFTVVICPITNEYIHVGSCADECDCYEGDGKDVDGMKCSYGGA